MCGKHGATNAHHRRNRSQGGKDVLSNLILLCGSGTTGCHGWVTENPDWAEIRGYTIKGTKTVPADVPVVRFDITIGQPVYVRLTDSGDLVATESTVRPVDDPIFGRTYQPVCVDPDCYHRGPYVPNERRAADIGREHEQKHAGTWSPA